MFPSGRHRRWQKEKVCFSCRRRKVQEFNIQEKLSVLHSRGQCRGSVAAESSRYSTFSSVFLWAVCVCAPLVTLSGTSTLKCQSSAEEKRPGVFKLLCSLSRSALSVTSARMCSHHTLSPRGLQHSLLESRPSHFTSSDDCNSPAFHAESSPTTHSNKCLSGPKACGDKDYQEELQTTTELEAFRWLLSSRTAFKAAVLNMYEAGNHSVTNKRII